MSIKTENGLLPTLEECEQLTCLDQIVGASEHLVRTLVSQDTEPDWAEIGPLSFEKYFAYLKKRGKKIDLSGCSMKMLRGCFRVTEDLTTLPFSLKWTGGGTTSNGNYSILNTTAYPKTGSVSLLSDILEVEVNQKYFLSKEQTERIVFTESDTGKTTDETRKSSIGGGITETLDTGMGGGRGQHTIEIIKEAKYPSGNQKSDIFSVGGVSRTLSATDYKQPVSIVQELSPLEIRTPQGEDKAVTAISLRG